MADGKPDPGFNGMERRLRILARIGKMHFSWISTRSEDCRFLDLHLIIQEMIFTLVRFLPDGSLDKSFNTDGIVVQGVGTRYDEGYARAANRWKNL